MHLQVYVPLQPLHSGMFRYGDATFRNETRSIKQFIDEWTTLMKFVT